MTVSDFIIPTTLTTAGVVIDPSGAVNNASLMYKTASSAFVATDLAVPIGTIRMFPSTATPTNYIICNGHSLNTYTYRTLHAVMSNKYGGTAYSAGVTDQVGAVTTFSLPNLSDTVFPYASNANTSLTTSINIGGTTASVDHSHTFPITLSAGAGTTTHDHTSNSAETGYHTHTWNAGTQSGGSHTHTLNSNTTSHDHLFIRSDTAGNDTTGNASANHSHSVGAPGTNHNHTANSGDSHFHWTTYSGGNHSSHNYQMTSIATAQGHDHSGVVTGIWFYIRFQ